MEKEEIRIKLNKDFYDINAIKDALSDFKKVCEGRVEDSEGVVVILRPKEKVSKEELSSEFCNYVLGMMKNKAYV